MQVDPETLAEIEHPADCPWSNPNGLFPMNEKRRSAQPHQHFVGKIRTNEDCSSLPCEGMAAIEEEGSVWLSTRPFGTRGLYEVFGAEAAASLLVGRRLIVLADESGGADEAVFFSTV